MLGKRRDIENMSSQIGKFAKWCVRIIDAKVIKFQFTASGETVTAERYECLLVSKDPTQYMLATIPFSFGGRQLATKSLGTFKKTMM